MIFIIKTYLKFIGVFIIFPFKNSFMYVIINMNKYVE